jgi:acetolactate synthase-1/2/3 large subunit
MPHGSSKHPPAHPPSHPPAHGHAETPVTGADVLVRALADEGVEVIFGIPGGVTLPIIKAMEDAPFRFILTRHEQGAAHMAEGFARATGKVGVCFATSGPGSTNLITGLADAFMDSTPIVAITGQVATEKIGNDAFQEVDTTGLTCTITKHNYLVRDTADIPRIVKEAFYLARSGRPGPVLIDIPVDVAKNAGTYHPASPPKIRGYSPTIEGHPEQIRRAAALIAKSERPILLAGQGVILADASQELRELAEKTCIPVATTLLGLGAFPEDHPLALKMVGMHGATYANFALHHADLVIGIGVRFDDRVASRPGEFAPGARIIHIDIDPTSIGKTVRADIPIVGSAKHILGALVRIVHAPKHEPWMSRIEEWKRRYALHAGEPAPKDRHDIRERLAPRQPWFAGDLPPREIKPQTVIRTVDELTRGEAIVTVDVGQHQMFAAQHLTHRRPRAFIASGGLGTMGFGFPAALGAQVGCPDRTVINITGDGSFQMNIQELATAVLNRIPVKVVLLNNGNLGMVRQWQETVVPGARYMGVILAGSPDFVKLAEAYGALGLRASRNHEVRPVLERLLAHPGPALADMQIVMEENCYPMVPVGRNLDEALGHDPEPA